MQKQNHVISVIRNNPLFLLLLPVFFVLHEFISHYPSVTAPDALLLVLLYIGSSLALAAIAWFFYRDRINASLIVFLLMFFQFFFGGIHDQLKNLFPESVLSQYRLLLPAGFLLFLAMLIWLKKRKTSLYGLTTYLNTALLLLIVIDAGRLVLKSPATGGESSTAYSHQSLAVCDTCKRPDIYLIIPDQYAGSTALKEVFDFSNTVFETALIQRGFYIVQKSRSNYNLTPFSVASTLNMDYLSPEMGVKNNLDVGYSYRVIQNNRVLKFLTATGYQFYNYSVFDFPGQPAHKYGDFLPYGIQLITWQTFTSRLARDLRADILSGKLGFKKIQRRIAYEYLHFNDDIFKLTRDIAARQSSSPKFVYTHLMLPHYPYYFDSKGNPLPMEKLAGFRNTGAADYIGYLQYGNQKILDLVDHILSASPSPPVIMLLSDHGFRHPEKKGGSPYDFMNLNAIFLPEKNYDLFHDSLTNVNHFRVFFNSSFNQRLPLLKDSTTDLWE